MSNLEIIGRPKYLPKKFVIGKTKQTQTQQRIQELSEQRREMKICPIDLVYERDENDHSF